MASVALGTKSVGSIVKLKENGAAVNYIVVHQGKPSSIYDSSCDGTWLLRQDIAENRVWDDGNVNKLESSDIHSYLNNTWINRYDTDIRNAIKQVKIPYRQNGGYGGTDRTGANGLSCKIFLLSGYEVGFTTSVNQYFPVDGAKLAYFLSGNDSSAQQKRVAKLNGSATIWWLPLHSWSLTTAAFPRTRPRLRPPASRSRAASPAEAPSPSPGEPAPTPRATWKGISWRNPLTAAASGARFTRAAP